MSALPNYVKFQRGSISAYNKLANKDDNTLYFIYGSTNSSTGSLYLGDKLISNNIGGNGATSLADLTDVLISNAATGDFLVLNSEGKWAAVDAATVAQSIIEAGGLIAEISIDNSEFEFDAVSGDLKLKGYDTATAGMVPVKGDNGLIWQAQPIDLSSRVGTLESVVTTIQSDLSAVDGKIAQAVAQSNHLVYSVIDNLSEAVNDNTIYLHRKSNSSDNLNGFDEYMYVNGALEKLGQFSIDLSNYVTTTTFNTLNTKVGNLETVVGDLSILNDYTNETTVIESLADIYERLTWQELNE